MPEEPSCPLCGNKSRFLLVILLTIAGIYGLWGVSMLVNRAAGPERPARIAPSEAIAAIEADLSIAERLAAEGNTAKAGEYASRVQAAVAVAEKETLTPAQRYLLRAASERLGALQKTLAATPLEGTSR